MMNYLIIDIYMFIIVAALFCAGAIGYVMGRNAEANRNKIKTTRTKAK